MPPPSPTPEVPRSRSPVVPTSGDPVVPWSRGPVVLWSCIAVFALLWLDLCRQLSYTWEINEQYAYGWFVPILALALFIRRWMDRPEENKAESRKQKAEIETERQGEGEEPKAKPRFQLSTFLVSAFILLLCLLWLPLRAIHEINQDWPLISWPLTAIVVALSLYALHLAGPKSVVSSQWSVVSSPWSIFSPWVRHFAFPVGFILVAVQWPYRIEYHLTQNLMQVVASLTVEIAGWFNIPAFQRGNLIEISTGVVGIDEACSGIRSFQSTLMAALFLGELYRLTWPRRLSLLVGGVFLSFALNVVRTFFLTRQAAAHGLSAVDQWHDTAGMSIFLVSFACLWALAFFTQSATENRKLKVESGNPKDCGLQASSREVASSPVSPGSSSPPDSKFQLSAFPISAFALPASSLPPSPSDFSFSAFQLFSFQRCRRYLIAVGLWALLCFAAIDVWYRAHASKTADAILWSVRLPETKAGFEKMELPARTATYLAYDQASLGKWDEDDGSQWTVYWFRWKPKSMEAVIHARAHRPEICLTGAGLRQISMSPLEYFPVGSLQIPFRKYTFEAGGQQLYVFFSLWQDGNEQTGMRLPGKTDRIQWVLLGRRALGQQTIEIVCRGYPDLAAAEQAVRQRLPELVQIQVRE